LSNFRARILNNFLLARCLRMPQRCLLCDAACRAKLICGPCDTALPRLARARCRRCATPIPLSGDALCGGCLASPPNFDRLIAPFVYDFPVDALIRALKYGKRLTIARLLANAMAPVIDEAADVILPMPLSEARLRERGFNQAQEIARHLGRATGIHVQASLCRRVRDTPPQAALPWKQRARNVRRAFVCDADLDGLRVAVVDDVATTCATLNEISRVLKRAGASRVVGWSAARALKHGAAG